MNKTTNHFMNYGYLVSPETANAIDYSEVQEILNYLDNLKEKPMVITLDLIDLLRKNKTISFNQG